MTERNGLGPIELAITLILFVTVFAVALANLRPGHDWGDDFALYINQARGIVESETQEVFTSNVYAREHSTGSGFSPDIYPWGFPLLLAPLYAIFGIDYFVFQLLEAMFLAVFVGLFAFLVVPRVGPIAGFLMTILIGSSVMYIGWTQSVTSDFPYLAMVGLALVLSDQARRRGILSGAGTGLLLVLGLAAGFAMSIRREGVVLFGTIAAVQAAAVLSERLEGRTIRIDWKRMALPHVAGLVLVAGFEIVFPGPLATLYEGGLSRVVPNAVWYSDVLARIIGLMEAGIISIFGNPTLGTALIGIFLVASVVGLVVRGAKAWRRDTALIVYLLGAITAIGFLPFHEGRYLFTIAPLLVYFAYQGLAETVRFGLDRVGSHHAGVVSAVLAVSFLIMLAGSNVDALRERTADRLQDDNPAVIWGPADPAAQELFAAVQTIVPEDEEVGFFRARAMTLLGERQGLQLTTLEDILEEADWYAMEKDSDYSQYPLDDEEAAEHGFIRVWENHKFVLWDVP